MQTITINGSVYPVASYRVVTTLAGRFELIQYTVTASGRESTEMLKRRLP